MPLAKLNALKSIHPLGISNNRVQFKYYTQTKIQLEGKIINFKGILSSGTINLAWWEYSPCKNIRFSFTRRAALKIKLFWKGPESSRELVKKNKVPLFENSTAELFF